MTTQDILHHRLANEQLITSNFTNPADIVHWFGAVQSQDYAGAKWALSQRLKNGTEKQLEDAYNNGEILRTHVMRPTWHFVHPEDIRWMLQLTAPRVNIVMGHYNRKLGIDEKVRKTANELIQKALSGGKSLLREELADALEAGGIKAKGQMLGHMMGNAELDMVICSGPRRGKQFTYMLLEERVPQAKAKTRDEALAELVKRYFVSHGPATIKDFVWWSGLTTADTKLGLEMNKNYLLHETIEDAEYWFADTKPSPMPKSVYLLPNYDELAIAYKDRDAFFEPKDSVHLDTRGNSIFMQMIFYQGKIIGLWRKTIKKDTVIIETKFFTKPTPEIETEFKKAADRFGEYLNVKTTIA